MLSSSDSLHNCTTIQGLIYLCRKLGFSISKSTRFCALAPSKSRYTEQLCSPAFQYNPRFRLCSCLMLSFPLFFLFLPSSHYLQILLSSSSSFSPVSFPLNTSKSARWVCWSDEHERKGWTFAWRKQHRGEWWREAWQR